MTAPASAASLREAGLYWILDSTFLAHVANERLDDLLGLAEWRRSPAGALMLPEGQPPNEVMLLAEGRARLRKRRPDGALADAPPSEPGTLVGQRSVTR